MNGKGLDQARFVAGLFSKLPMFAHSPVRQSVIARVLYTRRLRHREVKGLSQEATVGEWRG